MDNTFTPAVRFAVLSDIHIKDDPECREMKRLDEGLRYAYRYARSSKTYNKLDAAFFVGDFTDSGHDKEFENIASVLNRSINFDETKLYLSLASHDRHSDDDGSEENSDNNLMKYFGVEPDIHTVINGFHFISVSCDNHCRFSDDRKVFAEKALKESRDDDPKKPIFFFQHPHINGTVYGSVLWGDDDLYPILENYPQVVDFSGHSHAPINDPRSIHQKHFTSHGTGSLSYFELDEFDKYYGTIPPDREKCAQFLIVEADKNGKTVIKPFDILTQNFFTCGDRVIETPWDPDSFTYTDERYHNPERPHFKENTAINIKRSGGKITIEFEQAVSETERVNSYTMTVRRKSDSVIVKRISFWSGYYLYNMPPLASAEIELEQGEYNVEIEAEGFWHNKSDNRLRFTLNV